MKSIRIFFILFVSLFSFFSYVNTTFAVTTTAWCAVFTSQGCNTSNGASGCLNPVYSTQTCSCDSPYVAQCGGLSEASFSGSGNSSGFCRDGNIDPSTNLGGLQACGASGGCYCDYQGPSGPICSDPNDACFGQSTCCPASGGGGTPAGTQDSYFTVNANPLLITADPNSPYGPYTVTIQSNDTNLTGSISITESGGPDVGTFVCESFGPAPVFYHYTYTGTNPQVPANARTTCTFGGNSGNISPYIYNITFTGVYLSNGTHSSEAPVVLQVNAVAPPTPTGLSVTPSVTPSSCGQDWMNISWNASSGATSYQVYRDGGAVPVYDGAGLSFSDTGLVLGSTHSYKVRATNAVGSSAQSGAVSNTVAPVCPAIPSPTATSVTCNSATSATINYTLPAGYTTANVRVSKSNSTCSWPSDIAVTQTAGNPGSYGPFAVAANQPNCYWVETVDSTKTPSWSAAEGYHLFTCPAAAPTVEVESPTVGQTVSGLLNVKGYAVPSNETTINKVVFETQSSPIVRASSDVNPSFYPIDRTSVAPSLAGIYGSGGTTPRNAYPNIGFLYSNFDTNLLSNGAHNIIITAYDNAGNSTVKTIPITVNNTTAPTVSLSADPIAGASPLSTTLTWTISNSATSCTALGGTFAGSKSHADGTHTETVTNITTPTTYSITCSNTLTGNTSSVTVTPTTTNTLTVITTYGGAVTSNDGFINCGSTCGHTYSSCPSVVLSPVANPQFKFVAWTGACTGSGATCTVDVCASASQSVTSLFTLLPIHYNEF